MKTRSSVIVVAILFCASLCQAEEPKSMWQFDMADLVEDPHVQLVQPDGIMIENTEPEQLVVRLVTIEDPQLHDPGYVAHCLVRTEQVEGNAYLEMNSFFADGRSYFSKTLGQAGPYRPLTGTSDWQTRNLPFDLGGSGLEPVRLEINLVMPGRGRVYLKEMTLEQIPGNQAVAGAYEGAWWDGRTAGWIGAIIGCVGGLYGALVGTLGGMGRARWLVIGLMKGMIVAGGARR